MSASRRSYPYERRQESLGSCEEPEWVGAGPGWENLSLQYVSDKAKASAFIQEYATISGRKSDRSSMRAVRELRSGVRRLLGSPRQQLEQSFTPDKLAAAMNTVKAGKAGGPDGVAPDLLKHLPLNTQKELLFILNASWTTGWCPQA